MYLKLYMKVGLTLDVGVTEKDAGRLRLGSSDAWPSVF